MFIPWLSPEIHASMRNFLVNFSNSRSHAYLIFIQNRLPNSHSLPQPIPFLWITIHMAIQDRITWFSLLPFHGPCGPSYQQTLPSLPLSDVSSPTTFSLFHPITQATLLSYLCHPKSFLNPPADHSPIHPPVLSASQPPARSSKLTGFSHSPA